MKIKIQKRFMTCPQYNFKCRIEMQRARNTETTAGVGKMIERLGNLGWYHSIELPDGA